MTDKPVSRKDAKYAEAAKQRNDFHFAFPRDFATCVSCFDFFTPSVGLGWVSPPLQGEKVNLYFKIKPSNQDTAARDKKVKFGG
jgi:hypothetical protein